MARTMARKESAVTTATLPHFIFVTILIPLMFAVLVGLVLARMQLGLFAFVVTICCALGYVPWLYKVDYLPGKSIGEWIPVVFMVLAMFLTTAVFEGHEGAQIAQRRSRPAR